MRGAGAQQQSSALGQTNALLENANLFCLCNSIQGSRNHLLQVIDVNVSVRPSNTAAYGLHGSTA